MPLTTVGLNPTRDLDIFMWAGVAELIVRIAQAVTQPVQTSGNFQEFTI